MTAAAAPPARRKLHPRHAAWLMPLILSIFMSCIVSGVATLRGVGWRDDFFSLWISAWGLSWAIAFPTLLLVLPVVRKLVGLMVAPPPGQ